MTDLPQQPAPYKTSETRVRRGGRRSRDKGARGERALVQALQNSAIAAERIPLSGSAGGKFAGDVSIPLLGIDRIAEVKTRANGFRELYAWLDGRDLLALKADRADWLIVLPFKTFIEITAVLWVISGHFALHAPCPLYPQKQTFAVH